MLFNSYFFLLVFLPLVIAGFFGLGRVFGPTVGLLWLILVSLVFYASWEVSYLGLLLASMAFNYAAAACIRQAPRYRKLCLWIAVLANVSLLFYFKLVIAVFADNGAAFSTTHHLLIPLGISFITFQQIAFLVDTYKGRFKAYSPLEYVLFIVFFPQLVMGPIVHFRELLPQLRSDRLLRWSADNFSIGLSIFIVGLFKKVVLADSIAPFVDGVYSSVAEGQAIASVDAWTAALGFTLQIYFDFSAYADMAIGLARMLNINLPLNFDAPYRAVDRFDYWRRWHISFGAFMRQYVFYPLARAKRFRVGHVGALALTTLLSGFWHGLGATFIVWGALQSLLMLGVHYRGLLARKLGLSASGSISQWPSMLLTFLITILLGVLFRSGDLQVAFGMYERMIVAAQTVLGGNIAALYHDVGRQLDHMVILNLAVMMLVVWAMPSTHRLFANHWTALDQRTARPKKTAPDLLPLVSISHFKLNRAWAMVLAAMLCCALIFMSGSSRFIYYQF
ncbi:MAG: MBOAT family protein [Chromatocurvus sp.]